MFNCINSNILQKLRRTGFSLGPESQESLTLGPKFERVKMKFTRDKEQWSLVKNNLLLWKDQVKKQVSIYIAQKN